jgi:hypothetical protein
MSGSRERSGKIKTLPRAEEIIAETYRLIREKKSEGNIPDRVIMPFEYWKIIQTYRKSIGIIEGPVPDYLSENEIFGLEVWYGDSETKPPEIVVE